MPTRRTLATGLLATFVSACAVGPTPGSRGQLVGLGGATVCVDTRGTGRCEVGASRSVAGADGGFDLPGNGPLVAEADGKVLRGPAGSAVVSPVSTELVAMAEADGGSLRAARARLAARLGVREDQLLQNPEGVAEPQARAALRAETEALGPRIQAAVAAAGTSGDRARALRNHLALDRIETLVVIYAENRAFDNLYGLFPGANGIPGKNPSAVGVYHPQRDFDGQVLPVLPPAWGGLTAGGQRVTLTQAQSTGLPNAQFQIDDPKGLDATGVVVGQDIVTRDLVHRFYSNQLQIHGGLNDGFAAWSDAGGLSMGYYDGSRMRMWQLAQQYTLADNFFMGAFGGSFLNHQYLICGCVTVYPNADAPDSPAKDGVTRITTDAQGRFTGFVPAADMPATVLAGPPHYLRDSTLTPKDASGVFYAVNTMQSAYQPSGNAPAAGGDPRYADPAKATTLPPQTQPTIGDRLDAKGVGWAWYAGGWNQVAGGAPDARKQIYSGAINFQTHHQPFNYYADFDPATHAAARAEHLRDFDSRFYADAAAGKLPAVTFYKPKGPLNQHPNYANVTDGDAHMAEVIGKLQQSPQWPHMLIVVTYDENGGFYDHAPVPLGDEFGPGTRIPALMISPFSRRGYVDKTAYDTGSILRFITHRWSLAPLPGIVMRDQGLARHGSAPMGDLSGALDFPG